MRSEQVSRPQEVGATAAPEAKARAEKAPSRPSSTEQQFDDSSLNPKTVRQPNPYPTLPSTRALYTQFPDDTKALTRFGSEIFRPDVIGLSQFPMDLPAGPEYVLGPGDNVTLDIWGGITQKITRTVDRRGPYLASGSWSSSSGRAIAGASAKVDPGETRTPVPQCRMWT